MNQAHKPEAAWRWYAALAGEVAFLLVVFVAVVLTAGLIG